MRNTIILIGLATSLMAGPVMAKPGASTKQENIGVGTGATIGAVAGGPIGLIIGAAIGAKLGHEYGEKTQEVDALSGSLAGSQRRIADLQLDVDALTNEIDNMGSEMLRLQAVARPELIDLMQVGIEMDLLFRTDEYTLADITGTRLQNLAATIATMPDIHVQLDGFADERGDESYNQQLSSKRVDFVRELLVANGVSASRIKTSAHGESPAADTNIDSYALERRVSLTLYVDPAPSFAANPAIP